MRVVLCGSFRFAGEMLAFAGDLRALGVDAVVPAGADAPEEHAKESDAALMLRLAEEHFALIDGADAVFVFNRDGYAGTSVTLELGYALGKGKPAYALCPDTDLARQVSYAGIAADAAALAQLLAQAPVAP